MKYTLIFILLIVILMAVTKPELAQHEQGIREHVAQKNSLTSMMGAGYLSSKVVDFKNLTLLSTTSYDNDLVSVGLFDNVWIIPGNKLTDPN